MSNVSSCYRYETLIQLIQGWIQGEKLAYGQKLPSVRNLSQAQHVSMSTVLQAYRILEETGWIKARPQSGYYVAWQKQGELLEPETTQPQQALLKSVLEPDLVRSVLNVAMDNRFVHLGAATPGAEHTPIKLIRRLSNQLIQHLGPEALTYDFPPGNPVLREQLAKRTLLWQTPLQPDDLVLTNGAIEALNFALRAVAQPGDVIGVESPTFYGILQTIENLGMRVYELPTHPRSGVDLNALEDALHSHRLKTCVLVPNFNNPLGALMPDTNKQALIQLLTKYDMPLIENDIYGDLYFGSHRPRPVKANDTQGLVLYCGSVSKSLAPGLRVGWCAPGRYTQAVSHLKYMHSVSGPTLNQWVVSTMMASGAYDRHVGKLRRAFQSQVGKMREACAAYFPPGTRLTQPQGSYLLWVTFPENVDAFHLYQQALNHHIGIAPGHIFSTQPRYHHCIRLNAGSPWTNELEHAIQTLGQLAVTSIKHGVEPE